MQSFTELVSAASETREQHMTVCVSKQGGGRSSFCEIVPYETGPNKKTTTIRLLFVVFTEEMVEARAQSASDEAAHLRQGPAGFPPVTSMPL